MFIRGHAWLRITSFYDTLGAYRKEGSVIQAQHIFFTYPNKRGIFDINFLVARGEVFGFLGPNGAGKSTTIRTFLGFLQPKMGEASIGGINCWKSPHITNELVGYVPGEVSFLEQVTGMQYLKYVAGLRGLKTTEHKKRRDQLIDRFNLDPSITIKKLSKGNKQKIALVGAFMHNPEVYILDEPTSGLDPLMQNSFIDLVKEERNKGKTVLISSHIFDEVEKTADRIGIIKEGKMVRTEDLREIRASQQPLIYAELQHKKDVEKLKKARNMSVTSDGDTKVVIDFKGNYNYALSRLSVCHVVDMTVEKPSLEKTFFQYYAKDATDTPKPAEVPPPMAQGRATPQLSKEATNE